MSLTNDHLEYLIKRLMNEENSYPLDQLIVEMASELLTQRTAMCATCKSNVCFVNHRRCTNPDSQFFDVVWNENQDLTHGGCAMHTPIHTLKDKKIKEGVNK